MNPGLEIKAFEFGINVFIPKERDKNIVPWYKFGLGRGSFLYHGTNL